MRDNFHSLLKLLFLILVTGAVVYAEDFDIRGALIEDDDVPISFPYNQPSSVCETQNGTVVVAWRANIEQDDEETASWMYCSRKPSGAASWSDPILIHYDGDKSEDPSLFQPKTPGAPLYFHLKYQGRMATGKGALYKSTDDGATWSDIIPLPSSNHPWFIHNGGYWLGPGRNPPVEMPDGWLVGLATSEGCDNGSWDYDCWRVALIWMPPDNYEFNNAGAEDWRIKTFEPWGHGALGIGADLYTLSPDDYDEQRHMYREMAIITRAGVTGGRNIAFTTDAGETWSPFKNPCVTDDDGGTSPDECGAAAVSGVSLDYNNSQSPLNGWHLMSGADRIGGRARNGHAVFVSQDLEHWEKVFSGGANDDTEDG